MKSRPGDVQAKSEIINSEGKKYKDKESEKRSKGEEIQVTGEQRRLSETEGIVEADTIHVVEGVMEDVTAHSPVETNESLIVTDFIIENFEGEKVNGLFEGEGFMTFTNGNTYQGQFSNGLMHGHGCYKWVDGVTYEGDFYQNRISWKGLYTYPDGSSYNGEVFEGKRHGFGVYKLKDNSMSYSGQWSMGRKQGKGHLKYDSEGNSFYDGDWVNDLFHGWGKRRYPSGNEYQGMWYNNKRSINGTMKWYDPKRSKCSEFYIGQWYDGIQHGFGEHIWITNRSLGTHFDVRNSYIGDFADGMKHGKGIFKYADGATYDGEWYKGMKHGRAKFTQANGEIYTGEFVKNHLPPNTVVPGLPSFLTKIHCVSSYSKMNVREKNFMLDIDKLLMNHPEMNRKLELQQVSCNVSKHIGCLRNIYKFYSRIGCEMSADNVYQMSNLQYCRFLKDCRLHHHDYTLTEMNMLIEKYTDLTRMYDPFTKILQRHFIANLIILSFKFYHKRYMFAKRESKPPRLMLDWCFSYLLKTNIFPNAFKVKGYFFYESRKAMNINEHIDEVYQIYKSLCEQRKKSVCSLSIRMRDFLFFLKDMNLINENLTSGTIVRILAKDDPTIMYDGCYNLELEMTFMEFIEALVGCAEVYVTESVVESVSSVHQGTSCDSVAITPSAQQCTPSSHSPVINYTSTVPAEVAAEPESFTSIEGAVKSPSSKTTETPATLDETPDISTIGNLLLTKESDTKIMDLTKGSETNVALSKEDFQKLSPVKEYSESLSETLDYETKQYNFWTHQIHIFFIQKFIGPAKEILEIRRNARLKAIEEIRHAKEMAKKDAFRAEHPVKSVTPSIEISSLTGDPIGDEEQSESTA